MTSRKFSRLLLKRSHSPGTTKKAVMKEEAEEEVMAEASVEEAVIESLVRENR
jgi:hypothetical protein